MLKGFRKAGQSWLGKLLIAVMFGFLILSFAIWGVGDIFRGYGSNTVATVGSTEISVETVRQTYQNELQTLSRRFRRAITPEAARAIGLDQQVLARLVTEATLDERARAMGLAASDEAIARSIREDPTFRNAAGQFDRLAFDDILRASGLTEAGYVREQRRVMTRREIADGVAGGTNVPLAMREALHRYGAERRAADYVVLPAAAAGEIDKPGDAALKTYFEERKTSFRAPEYRKVTLLALTPESVARPADVSDADARARYAQIKDRFGSPERRKIQQIVFPSEAEARAASDKIRGGATFEAVAAERGIAEKDLELGTFARTQLFDEAVAAAAFALPEGGVSPPVAGRFGIVLVRVVTIEPERVKPFEEVAGEVKAEVARERARTAIVDLHDRIEDLRAAAKPLPEIASTVASTARTIEAVDRNGLDKAGQAIGGLPDKDALLAAVFASDIGVDNEALRLQDGGYLWFDVAGIEPARDRALDEVRDEVVKQWTADEVARRLSDKARGLVERLDKGEAFAAVAASVNLPVKKAEGLARSTPKDDLTASVVGQIFATPAGKAGSAALGDGEARVVFRVIAATVPPLVTSTQQAENLEQQLRIALTDDLLSQYVARLQADLGVRINQQALRNALGGGEF
ncbi:SurA N-terminal domain-containing protein [Chelatococcus sp. SYSU_G07232]|uniref:Parvulin-like PPIase n=1 Tax=Chelatococcus albus TaxID=3047466 RepID=A0ABT7ABW1_9HYPH|nr:SurA N-terminal domain-containing protein [Chelatococcus sp. SYSU_G07232]MDJ1156855.1 SurA N-terminal domain-containing protein [Chelatococcus sp. SYSU_G07232]